MSQARAVALIQARGGSKGVPGKNIRPLGGFPLIAWSVVACRLAETIGRVVLSTDSKEIAEVAKAYGVEVPFMRPAAFATDTATDFVVIRHALEWFRDHEGHVPELVVQIRPTTPLREPALIDEAVRRVQAHPEATSLRSVFEMPESHCKMFGMKEDGFLHGLCPDDPRPEYFNLPRQAFPSTYFAQGYVDVIRASTVLEQGMCYGERILGFVTPDSGEVDREEDFRRLELLMGDHGRTVHEYMKTHHSKTHRL